MAQLSPDQIAQFRDDGYLMLPDALSGAQLRALNGDLERWIDESRDEVASYGQTLDRRPRFDLEADHCATAPALRRVASPQEISTAYLDAMHNNRALDALSELISADIRFHHGKVNAKLPGTATEVRFHQDFLFTPHSNDDLVTVLYFLDDVDDENGPPEVVPGSHRGPLHGLWHDGVFTGAIDEAMAATLRERTVRCTGSAGTACLMHTRLLHCSGQNRSPRRRTLFIVVYAAADAVALSPNPLPSAQAGEIVRGLERQSVRCSSFEMTLPEIPSGASFFTQQVRQVDNPD